MSYRHNSYVAIVDDDESVCRSFGRLLRTAGYQSVTYTSAEAFLDDRKRPHFDCLVLDLQLPGISGIELGHRLHAVNDSTPIVFITAKDDPDERASAEAAGCVGYFRKTDPGADILHLIRTTIQKALSADTTSSLPPSSPIPQQP
jgi:FixJ family two-component response regulator